MPDMAAYRRAERQADQIVIAQITAMRVQSLPWLQPPDVTLPVLLIDQHHEIASLVANQLKSSSAPGAACLLYSTGEHAPS